MLYDHAHLNIDNSELDALKRLASTHNKNAALLSNSEDMLPTLPLSTQLCTGNHLTVKLQKNVVPTSAVSASAQCKVKVEQASSQQPAFAKRAKLLLIPNTADSVTGQSRSRLTEHDVHSGRNCEQIGLEKDEESEGKRKRKNASDGGSQKSVPLGDVMNVKLTSAHHDQRSRISLIPLSSVASASNTRIHCSSVQSEWNQQVKIKQEPGTSCPGAGKRKLPVVYGMYLCS